MTEVTVSKTALLEILRKNREEHLKIFEESFSKFKERLAAVLESLLQRVSEGKIPGYLDEIAKVTEPENHTREYDRAIKMLEMEIAENVTISARQFASLVEDEWDWSARWAHSNVHYSHHEKVLKFIGS